VKLQSIKTNNGYRIVKIRSCGGVLFVLILKILVMPNDNNNQNRNQDNLKGTNAIKNPDDWKTGDESMTGAQKSYLQTLSDSTGEEFDENLTKAEAAKRIDELQKNRSDNSNQDSNLGDGANINTIKDPDDWKTGDEEMTGAQKSYLKTLSDEAGEEMDENITKAEASKKIDELQEKTGRGK
jgi:hypothetical protein